VSQAQACPMNPENLFGQTRTRQAPLHALIAPDGHVISTFPGCQAAAHQLIRDDQQVGQLTQQLAERLQTGWQSLDAIAAIAKNTQTRVNQSLRQAQAVERLTEEMTSMSAALGLTAKPVDLEGEGLA
ncbi:MAG: hypothetical protein AAF152_17985, partial [Cyanobacteria bacterium P01_A01_bin.114]